MEIKDIPNTPGVYIFKDSSFSIIYIGKAKKLRKRISQYFFKKALETWKTASIQMLVKEIDFIPCASEREALLLERQLINKYQPFFNVLWKDSKTYPYIKITKEDYPRILLTRKKIEDGADYYGPYPKVDTIRNIFNSFRNLKLINLRRCNFSFSVEKPLDRKKILHCIYYHTKQCPAPCDSSRITKPEYDRLVKRAKDFFSGKYFKLISIFKKDMKKYSDIHNYEKAAMARDLIRAIEHISEKVLIKEADIDSKNFDLNLLKGDYIRIAETLQERLNLKKAPYHVEAFDVSNLSGRYAVGASVCFINGQNNYGDYRLYRIKYSNPSGGANDFAMIYEIVKRRIKKIKENKENMPDLFLIDGGLSQLNMAIRAAQELRVKAEFISLAKRNEEIYIPFKKEPFILEKDDPALNFLRKVRDEVHRFGVTYHKKIRDKSLLK